MSTAICAACGTNPAIDAYACTDCAQDHQARLRQAPAILHELETEVRKQARKQAPQGHPPKTRTPIPINLTAVEIRDTYWHTLAAAWETLNAGRNRPTPHNTQAVIKNLQRYAENVPLHPDGPTIIQDLAAIHTAALDLIDLPEDTIRVGNCDNCDRPLYPPRTATIYACPACRAINDVAAKLRHGLRRAHSIMLTPDRIEKVTLGRVKASNVRRWRKTGELTPDADGRVRLGDAINRQEQTEQRKHSA